MNPADVLKTIRAFKMLFESKRPLIIVGAGARNSNMAKLISMLNVPYLVSWAALDYFNANTTYNIGTFGVTSPRIGNYAVKHADYILSIGCRLDTHMAGDYKSFAPNAIKVLVDIDPEELKKKADIKINIDSSVFASIILEHSKKIIADSRGGAWPEVFLNWKDQIQLLRDIFKIKLTPPYMFIKTLAEEMSNSYDISLSWNVVSDAGQTVTWTFQGWPERSPFVNLFTAFNNSPMGYSLPASVGAYLANNLPTICIIGDGGLQMNLQELQTIVGMKLPIKIFVMNNSGYGMLKQTQSDWDSLAKNVATDPPMANLKKVAKAFGLKYYSIRKMDDASRIRKILKTNVPVLCDVRLPSDSKIEPKLKFGDPLERQSPYLTPEEEAYINESLALC